MEINNIIFLDDILREDFINSRAFIYQLLREPLKQVLELDSPDPLDFPEQRGLTDDFQAKEFKRLCNHRSWIECYPSIPKPANEYLFNHIQRGSLIIGYEMPNWLIEGLKLEKLPWINVRLSPIRFARDLYIVLQSSFFDLRNNLKNRQVTDNEIRIEAGLLRAAALHNKSRGLIHNNQSSKDIIYLGQTKADSSLISDNGNLLRVEDFSDEIIDFSRKQRIFYKAHPADKAWGKREKSRLEDITQKKISVITQNTYTLFAGDSSFNFIGISSGALQEAIFFDQHSKILHKPICDFRASDCAHVRFMDFISPALWREIFGINASQGDITELSLVSRNMMRSLHNAWWGYSSFILENDNFFNDAFSNGLKKRIRRPFRFLEKIFFRQ